MKNLWISEVTCQGHILVRGIVTITVFEVVVEVAVTVWETKLSKSPEGENMKIQITFRSLIIIIKNRENHFTHLSCCDSWMCSWIDYHQVPKNIHGFKYDSDYLFLGQYMNWSMNQFYLLLFW